MVQVLIKLRGQGFGVFSYLRGYTFEVKSTHAFKVPGGKTVLVNVVAWEKGDATTPLDERPVLRINEQVSTGALPDSLPAPAK